MLLRDAHYPADEASSVELTHVLLTRFNMRTFREQRGIADVQSLQQWFDHRLGVFGEVCLPSVVQQSMRPHRWYVGVDGLQPQMAEPLAELCAGEPWIVLVEQGADDGIFEPFERAMHEDGLEDAAVVVTTRLDNDDALALDFVEHLDAYARAVLAPAGAPQDFWLAFPFGAQLSEGVFRSYMHTHNHFLARVVVDGVRASRGATALAEPHSKVFELDQPAFTPLTSAPMWLQNVHGHNVSNKEMSGRLALGPRTRVARRFGLAQGRNSQKLS